MNSYAIKKILMLLVASAGVWYLIYKLTHLMVERTALIFG